MTRHEHGVLILIHLILHLRILEGEYTQLEIVRFLDDHVLNGLELLLLGQRFVLSGRVLVVSIQFIPQPVPVVIALRHFRELGKLIHNGIHLGFHRFFQIAVHLFAFHFRQHCRQHFHLLRNHRTVT